MAEPKITTRNIFPPIPVRQFDWVAHYDGDDEAGARGYGDTEAEAIKDLTDNFPWDGASLS